MPGGKFFSRFQPLSTLLFVITCVPMGSLDCFGSSQPIGSGSRTEFGSTEFEYDESGSSGQSGWSFKGGSSSIGFGGTRSGSIGSGSSGSGSSGSGSGSSGSSDPTPIQDSADIGFSCTEANGNVLGCTNLATSCSVWWPSCSRRSQIGDKSIPSSCQSAAFRVIQYATGEAAVNPSAEPSHSNLSSSGSKSGPEMDQLGAANRSNVTASFKVQKSNAGPQAASTQAAAEAVTTSTDTSNTNFAPETETGPGQAAVQQPSRGRVGNSEVKGGGAPAIEGAGVSAARFLDPNAAAAPTTASYTDPALAYAVTSGSRESLVEKLMANPAMREELRSKLREASATGAASDPDRQETFEYYKKALAEANGRVHGSSLSALTPLGSREAFSMNGDESEKEIQRLTASMGNSSEDELMQTPLFPRVHEALVRQAARGNVKFVPKRTLSASAP
jgi:hypothetical protein